MNLKYDFILNESTWNQISLAFRSRPNNIVNNSSHYFRSFNEQWSSINTHSQQICSGSIPKFDVCFLPAISHTNVPNAADCHNALIVHSGPLTILLLWTYGRRDLAKTQESWMLLLFFLFWPNITLNCFSNMSQENSTYLQIFYLNDMCTNS